MYENAAMLAVFLLIYSAIAGRIERSLISGPIVFTAVGFILGADGLGILRIHIDGEGLRLLAELTLAMVLFTDAANANFSIVKRNLGLPERLLGIGLPLTIVLGFLAAAVVFPRLEILEMTLLAAILAPTDAALGKPVVTNPAVLAAMREALNLESGSQRWHLRADCRAVARTGRGDADRGRDLVARRSGGCRSDRYRADRRSRLDVVDHLDAPICREAQL